MVRRLTNLFCYGKHFLNVLSRGGGEGGGGASALVRKVSFSWPIDCFFLLDHTISDQ